MSLEIGRFSELYKILLDPQSQLDRDDEDDEDDEFSSGTTRKIKLGSFKLNSSPVPLPDPLSFIQMSVIGSFSRRYHSCISITAMSEDVFKGLSRKISKHFDSPHLRWAPVNRNGSGYLVKEGIIPLISIYASINADPIARHLVLGEAGCHPLYVAEGKENRFFEETNALVKTAQVLIEECIGRNNYAKSFHNTKLVLDVL